MKDWGDADFPVRARVGREFAVGETEMFLEHLGFILAIPEIDEARRRRLLALIEARLMNGEVLGARQRETPGSRENGGIWHALNGNLLTGLAALDPAKARIFAEAMTLRRHSREFPTQWVGQWSGGDSQDPSLPAAGKTAESAPDADYARQNRAGRVNPYLYPFPVFCAHAHAWPLMAHHLLNGKSTGLDRDKTGCWLRSGL